MSGPRYTVVQVFSCRGCPRGEPTVVEQGVAGVLCRAANRVSTGRAYIPDWCPLPKEAPTT